jgi:uncharacterized protein with von Willebrand factor type A (vWA) domain
MSMNQDPPQAALPDVAVDGRRLLRSAVGFGRALRRAGLSIDLGAEIDYPRALELIDIGDREEFRAAGAALFVRSRDDLEIYNAVFDRYWRRRVAVSPEESLTTTVADEEAAPEGEEQADQAAEGAAEGDEQRQPESMGRTQPIDERDREDEEEAEGLTVSPEAWSASEVLRHRDFDRMTPQELREAERLVDLLVPRLELRRTRRYELHRHGRILAARAMLRANLGTGGQFVEWVWRRATRRPRPLVVLCDISGSMERHSRLLLRFIQALSAASAVKTESFVFGTRLTRVTRLLRDRDRDRALTKVADSVNDWAGGTRIGESFREFNQRWARRTLRTSGVVIVVSDGWDRGDPALVATETARLRRNCHRLIWLNPLAGTPGYQPLAAGMRAAYPYIDDFLPAGTVASLERLGEILAGVRGGDTVRRSEAAAHSPRLGTASGSPGGAAPSPIAQRVAADRAAADRATPRPLR